MLDDYLQMTSGSAHSAVSWVWRTVILGVIAAIGHWCMPAQASEEDIRRVEFRLRGSEDEGDNPCIDRVFSEIAFIVLPDGRRALLGPSNRQAVATGLASVNLVVADSDYIEFLSVPGRATLIGKEKVRWENRAERMCWFVRHYERMHGQWRITFAQWTISPSDGKPL
jgi:hypothetical protein